MIDLDVFFLLNTGMDLVIFIAESFFIKSRVRIWRLLVASIMGALFAILMLLLSIHRVFILFVLLYAVVDMTLVYIAFGKTTLGALLRHTIIFWLAGSVLGGILTQLIYVFLMPAYPVWIVMTSGVLLVILRISLPYIHRRTSRMDTYCGVRLYYADQSVTGKALVDTGNHLYEPFSHQPVILGDRDFIKRLYRDDKEPIYRIIPYHSVGEQSGMLPAFQADMLEVESYGRWRKIEKPWVAVCKTYLSADGEYEVILHPDFMIGEKNGG